MRLPAALRRLAEIERGTRPTDPEVTAALAARWEQLPAAVRSPSQMLGRKFTGCEATHGVFPACNFGCRPCYLPSNSNRVPLDPDHALAEIERQMSYLRQKRGPGQYAQLIGGEVSLLPPDVHAEALQVMRRHGRFPMSFSHGDFDYDYLERLAVGRDGTRRFHILSFAVHIDTTMYGRRAAPRPSDEGQLHPERRRVKDMFERLQREHGVRHHLAHTMTVTPANVDEVADVVRVCRDLGYRMCSFQPAAEVGDRRRWDGSYAALTDDRVWAEIERGVGRHLPHRVLEVGDPRCNRVTWGLWSAGHYVPVAEDDHPGDLAARDAFFRVLPGNLLFASRPRTVARVARAMFAHPRDIPVALRWGARLARRLGARGLVSGVQPATYVMHSFMDADDVQAAWHLLQRDQVAGDPRIRATQERLSACAYGMAHPDRDEVVPACVQHSVLDEVENAHLLRRLPLLT
ncbi:MAG: radical SAM protein [Actinobacteria bacterium]|nr:radical SAM protein [Actinomycetota bacterium]